MPHDPPDNPLDDTWVPRLTPAQIAAADDPLLKPQLAALKAHIATPSSTASRS